MFLKIRYQDALQRHVPEFTVIAAPVVSGLAHGGRHAHGNLHHHQFPGTAGHHRWHQLRREIKKTIFTVLNFLLPLRRALHALLGQRRSRRDVAIFFGLSGTGKTRFPPIQAPPIGDDEHG